MKTLPIIPDSQFRKRINAVKEQLGRHGRAALLVTSSAPALRTRNQTHHYEPDRNFFYLTGCSEENGAILISTELAKPLFLAPPRNPARELWDGPQIDAHRQAKRIGAEGIISAEIGREVRNHLTGIEHLFYQNIPGTLGWEVAEALVATPSHLRGKLPHTFSHLDQVLVPLRIHKDKYELLAMQRAALVTIEALRAVEHAIKPGLREVDIKTMLEAEFALRDCACSFQTIVAAGPGAATLHHLPTNRVFKPGELVLLDFGAAYGNYCSDMTRVLATSDVAQPLKLLHKRVCQAQAAAKSKVKHGVQIKKVYEAAAEILTEALIELRVLKGSTKQLMKKASYKRYFPHGIGHSVGLDIHDVGDLRANLDPILEEGMVFTVEPGLYFGKKAGLLPPCGVRIEDTVVVTKKGHVALTAGFERELTIPV